MKIQITILFFLITFFNFSQSNHTTSLDQNSAVGQEIARLYEKVLMFKDQGLFLEVYDRQNYWSCTPDKDEAYINSRLNELDEIRTKWEKPNGDIAKYNSYVMDLETYAEKNCSKNEYTCKFKNMKHSGVEKSMYYLELYIAKFKECLTNLDSSSNNKSTSSYSNNTSKSNQSLNDYRSQDQRNADRINQQTQQNVARVKQASDEFSSTIKSLFVKTKKDRSNEPLIKDRSYENKSIVANWQRENNAHLEALNAEKKQRLENFKAYGNDTLNHPTIRKAIKHYEFGNCPNESCKDGKIYNETLKICGGCRGKGYTQFGVWVNAGETRHPNDGKEQCESCNGLGIREYRKPTDEKCPRCHGFPNKALFYVGDQSISKKRAEDLALYIPNEIAFYMNVKDFFKQNPEKDYYYKLLDDGKKYTGIRFINKELEDFTPENRQEIIDGIFEEKRKAQEHYEKYGTNNPVEKIEDTDNLWIADELRNPRNGKRAKIINKETGEEIISVIEKDLNVKAYPIDSVLMIPILKKIVTYHTGEKGKLHSLMFDTERNTSFFEKYGYKTVLKKFKPINYFHDKYNNTAVLFQQYSDGDISFIKNDGEMAKVFLHKGKHSNQLVNKFHQIDNLKFLAVQMVNDNDYKGDKWGILNYAFWTVVPAKFDAFGNVTSTAFNSDLIPAKYKGKWGFIDRSGKTVIKFKYQIPDNQNTIHSFQNGKVTVKYKDEIIDINKEGEIIK